MLRPTPGLNYLGPGPIPLGGRRAPFFTPPFAPAGVAPEAAVAVGEGGTPVPPETPAHPFAPPYTGPVYDDAPVRIPTRRMAESPRLDFGFLRQPLKGGNLWKTLGTVLGGAALLQEPGQALGGIFGGLNAYRDARQSVLDREYTDKLAAAKMEQAKRDALQKAALEREKIDAANRRAGMGLFGSLVKMDPGSAQSQWEALGLPGQAPVFSAGIAGTGQDTASRIEDRKWNADFRANKGLGDLVKLDLTLNGPTPSGMRNLNLVASQMGEASPMGLSPDFHFNEDPAGLMQPGGLAYLNQQRGIGEAYKNKVLADPRYIESKAKAPGVENNARYFGALDTRSRTRERDTLLPYRVGRTKAETNYLNNVRTPMGLAGLEEQRITNRYLPDFLQGRNAGQTLGNVGRAVDMGLLPMSPDGFPPGTNPDGTFALPPVGNQPGFTGTPRPKAAVAARAKPAKAAAGAKAEDPWKGIPSGFRSEVLGVGIAPKVPPAEAQSFVQEWTQKGGLRRDFRGNLVEGTNQKAVQAMRQARQGLNAQYKGGAPSGTGVSTVDALK